eukprot:10874417-Ditylum_brightwellii.AAC.1
MKKPLCIVFPPDDFSPFDLGEEEAYNEDMKYIPNLEKTGYVNCVICIENGILWCCKDEVNTFSMTALLTPKLNLEK